jgi:hypothetical protein
MAIQGDARAIRMALRPHSRHAWLQLVRPSDSSRTLHRPTESVGGKAPFIPHRIKGPVTGRLIFITFLGIVFNLEA